MVGVQDALQLDMEGGFFLIKRFLIFCSMHYEFYFLLLCYLWPLVFQCSTPSGLQFACFIFVFLGRIQHSKTPKLKTLILIFQLFSFAGLWRHEFMSNGDSTSHPSCLPLLPITFAYYHGLMQSLRKELTRRNSQNFAIFLLDSPYFFHMFLVPHEPKMSFDVDFGSSYFLRFRVNQKVILLCGLWLPWLILFLHG